VSRSPLRPATLPRLRYPSEVDLAPVPSSTPIGHLARHHTQVNRAALRRPANKDKAQSALMPPGKKTTQTPNIARNIPCAARFHIPHRTPICSERCHACPHSKWDSCPQVPEYVSLNPTVWTSKLHQSRVHKHCGLCRGREPLAPVVHSQICFGARW